MAYQTVAGLRALYGEKRLAEVTPASPETAEAYWTAKLSAAAAFLNSHLQMAGYAIPADTTLISNATARAEVEALLADWTGVLALEAGAPALVSAPKGVASAADRVRSGLEDLIRGRIRFPLPFVRRQITSVPGPESTGEAGTGAPLLSDALFQANRTATEP